MADTAALTGINGLRRHPPQPGLPPGRQPWQSGSVPGDGGPREVPFLTMVGVRVVPASGPDHGSPPSPAACRSAAARDRRGAASVLWLGPDEFLVVHRRLTTTPWAADLHRLPRGALGDAPGPVIDLSANRTTFELAGPRARAVLEKGCPLDLHPRIFAAGTAPCTAVGTVPVILLKTADGELPDASRAPLRRLPGPLAAGRHGGVRVPRGALMALSALDLFSVGIGPSSSHTVGPMRAADLFADGLKGDGLLSATARVQAELFGSLGATGHGHGSDKAVILGLQGQDPETVDTDTADDQVAAAVLDADSGSAGTTGSPSTGTTT